MRAWAGVAIKDVKFTYFTEKPVRSCIITKHILFKVMIIAAEYVLATMVYVWSFNYLYTRLISCMLTYLLSLGCGTLNESKEPLCVREVWVCTLGSSLPESVVESGPRWSERERAEYDCSGRPDLICANLQHRVKVSWKTKPANAFRFRLIGTT